MKAQTHQSTERFDALVVGAKVAGAATALQLARRGLRVLVIDRAPEGADSLSTHAVMRTGAIQLARWGVLHDLLAQGTPTISTTVFHYGDDPVHVDITPDRFSSGLLAPRRAVLDQTLVKTARSAGAEVRHRCRLIRLTRDRADRVNGAVIAVGDREWTVRAGMVVGADGADSAVARDVAAPARPVGVSGSTCTVYTYIDGFDRSTSHWHFGEAASSGVIPTNDGLACVFVSVRAERFAAEIRGNVGLAWWRLLRSVSAAVAEQAEAAEISRFRSFPGRRPHVRQAHGPGWALVGDAGLYDDPATAHGISAALRDAELAAEAIVTGDFRRYQQVRDALAGPISTVTDRIASFGWDFPALRAHHVDLSRAMRLEADTVAGWPSSPVSDIRSEAV